METLASAPGSVVIRVMLHVQLVSSFHHQQIGVLSNVALFVTQMILQSIGSYAYFANEDQGPHKQP